jgi:15-cis-phytoene synthase
MTASNAVSAPPQPAFVCRRVDHDDERQRGGRVSRRELDAAGITEPALRESYERCRRINASHGRTYYLATLLLPPAKRPYVHALYGLARYADELVDDLAAPDPAALLTWGKRLLDDLALGDSTDPIGRAAVHTARTWDIPVEHFDAFFASMRMDITRTGYATYADLEGYMYGSAAVIGLQMLPLLEPLDAGAATHARQLGEAFQLSNFIRDVAEDLRRGRVYLPQEDLAAFGVTRGALQHGVVTRSIRELLRFEVARARAVYRAAAPGIGLLHPSSRDCISTAFLLYSAILDEVENADYEVLRQRVSVPTGRRLSVAGPALLRAWRARRATPPTPRRPA